MKASTLIVVLLLAVALAGIAFFVVQEDEPGVFILEREMSLVPTEGTESVAVVFAADRVNASGDDAAENRGFIESVEYDTNPGALRLTGWTPVELLHGSGRLIVRDPFGAALPTGEVQLIPQEREDVRRALGDASADGHYGFKLRLPLQEAGSGSAWFRSLEMYAEDEAGTLFALSSANGRAYRTWSRSPDAFEFAVVFAEPAYAAGAPDDGHVDVVESGAEQGTVRIHGWAPFDARSPDAFLCLRLPAGVAPASIVGRQAHLRPDVPPVVDPERPELQYGGFILTVAISGTAEDLRREGAFAIWTQDDGESPVSVHVGSFE